MEVMAKQRALLLGMAGLGAAVAVTWLFQWKTKRRLRKVGEVSQLFLYPVKSCRGIALEEVECREYGLRSGHLRDRHWLVVKENKVQVTASQEPRMVLITATCGNGHLTLRAPDMADLHIPLELPKENAVFNCKLHGHAVQGRDCGEDASIWITGFLRSDQRYRLVKFEDTMKLRNPKNEHVMYTENVQVAYSDLSPLLLLSEASLDDLNSRLETKITVGNFRPNILISACDAFDEDTWDEIQIGSQVTLRQVIPCPRCILTTVDPDTGIINMKEPLKTLRSYRLCDTVDKAVYKSSPLFGRYVKVMKKGTLKVGDPVYHITY
ncbi:mitochondrial amidoxime reducing component 2-like isoform X2 [Pseudophryne corroboree]|uniref:mitochondrial amidoxime reducing component 2-like isoform X2 n=1 Tax=Pseudophryne corroboree TaxID=495146 RepID=UPI003081491B